VFTSRKGSSEGAKEVMPPVKGWPHWPLSEICGKSNWTPGMKFSDYMLVLCQKPHI